MALAVQDPILLLAFVLLAITGGDVALLVTAALGSGGVAAIMTAFVGLKRLRMDARKQRAEDVQTLHTVAADEAKSAMQLMGDVVDRIAADLQNERRAREASDRKLRECQEQCDQCLEAVRRLRRQEGQS